MISAGGWKRLTRVAAALGALAPAAAPAQARLVRHTTLVGSVRDSAGHAISGVEVWLRDASLVARTNVAGGFRITDAPEGPARLSLRRLGFEQATVDVNLKVEEPDSLVISLTALATSLPGVTVEEKSRAERLLAGFWDRRANGQGRYLTREQIDDRKAHDFVDLVRMTPGVSIVNVGGRPQVRFRASQTIRGDCPPLYWVDGIRVEGATGEEFPPNTLEAIEIYNGTATIPLQYQPRVNQLQKTCGAVVIWSRLPGS